MINWWSAGRNIKYARDPVTHYKAFTIDLHPRIVYQFTKNRGAPRGRAHLQELLDPQCRILSNKISDFKSRGFVLTRDHRQ